MFAAKVPWRGQFINVRQALCSSDSIDGKPI